MALHLSQHQIQTIQNFWSIVKKDLKIHGQEIVVALFEAHKDTQKLFKDFSDVPLEEIRENRKFKAHVTTVMFSLSAVVSNLDDDDVLQPLMEKITENHSPRGVTKQEFEVFFGLVLEYFRKNLKKDFNKEVEDAFMIFAKAFLAVAK